jgi:hypothetical protein
MNSFAAEDRATIATTTIEGQVLQLIEYFQILKAGGGNTTNFFAETAGQRQEDSAQK